MRISDWSSDVCSSDLPAIARRQQWLVEQQLADGDGDLIRLRANAIMMLQRRELLRAGDDLAVELGKPFVEARAGEAIEGRIVSRMVLASRRFALVDKRREFNLTPWKPGLQRQLGPTLAGRVGHRM